MTRFLAWQSRPLLLQYGLLTVHAMAAAVHAGLQIQPWGQQTRQHHLRSLDCGKRAYDRHQNTPDDELCARVSGGNATLRREDAHGRVGGQRGVRETDWLSSRLLGSYTQSRYWRSWQDDHRQRNVAQASAQQEPAGGCDAQWLAVADKLGVLVSRRALRSGWLTG